MSTRPAPGDTKSVARAPDRPPLPSTPRSWLVKAYLLLSAAVLAVFVVAGLMGWELAGSSAERAPGSARQSPGGYRSYHFWHTGYSGGK